MKLRFATAAGLVLAAGGAHAQSSVTLYGVLDAGLLYQSTSAATFAHNAPDTGKVYRFKDGGIYSSIWGLKATEDLGGGYFVNVKLQGSFDSGTGKSGLSDTPGATAMFNQYATVGVSGPFGTFNAGRQIVPMIWAMYDTDVRRAQYFGSVLTAWLGMNTAAGWPGTSTNGSIGALYDSNALVYVSPTWAGLSASLEYAPGGVAGQFQGGTRESAVLKYSNFGLTLTAVYYNGHDANPAPGSVPTGLNNNRMMYFGGLYTTHGFSFSLSYANGKNPANSDHANYDMYSGGLGYRFAPDLNVTTGVYYIKDKNDSSNHSLEVAIGAEYNLSKRTLAYAEVGHVNNNGTMNQMIVYGQPTAPGKSTTAAMLGLRHNF
ncbi:porin [Caballeronia temeraria]|uniref:Porin n=1 Tax=Caballeronia temeraria TaxID=1777137 RepID=A0A157ZU78_9BURK|nr:porin [Caballeronia temeraria]SAK49029.1 porin [Caballeronia temeraria]